jgi:hypothetical protein
MNTGKYKMSLLLTGRDEKEGRDGCGTEGGAVLSFVNWVVLPGTVGKESVVFIIVILVAAFAISTLLDVRKKKKGK